MACEFGAIARQTINPGENFVFTLTQVPCRRGLVRHREGTGNFLLAGVGNQNGCPCRSKFANYLVDFGANVAIPEGGTVAPISVAITIDGATIPASTMTVTPAAVEEFFNISRAITADIFRGCCETVSVKNIGTTPIVAEQANILFDLV